MPYSEKLATRAVKFISRLKHSCGQWQGQRFQLLQWQEDIIRKVFGTLKEDGFRQYKFVYIEIPKKNGKTELIGATGLYLLFGDKEKGAEIYSAAADREQASIVYSVSAYMVRQEPELNKICKVRDSTKRIIDFKNNAFYHALSSDVPTKSGLKPHGILFDELHTQPNRDLYDILTIGAGASRRQPLIFIMTTAGFDRTSICWEVHEYAEKVKNGVIDDPTFLPVIYGVPMDADWEDESEWIKANPSLNHIFTIENLREEYRKAKEIPAMINSFRRLRLNQWTRSETKWMDIAYWNACQNGLIKDNLKGRKCYAGLDLSTSIDLSSLVLVFPPDNDSGTYDVLPFYWIPKDNIEQRIKRDRVPYDVWINKGFIDATPGNVIDYAFIIKKIEEISKIYDLQEIAYDRWGATKIIQDLQEKGMKVIEFGQGFASMSPPTKEFQKLVMSQKIRHDGNPVLKWNVDNLVVREDPAGNIKPDKEKSIERIDGTVATIMGLDRALRLNKHKSIYEDRGVLVFK